MQFFLKNPRLKVDERFYDRSNFLKDVETYVGGMELFRR